MALAMHHAARPLWPANDRRPSDDALSGPEELPTSRTRDEIHHPSLGPSLPRSTSPMHRRTEVAKQELLAGAARSRLQLISDPLYVGSSAVTRHNRASSGRRVPATKPERGRAKPYKTKRPPAAVYTHRRRAESTLQLCTS
jgi:hypothetical protein